MEKDELLESIFLESDAMVKPIDECTPYNYGDEIVQNIEAEYKGAIGIEEERKKEKEKLEKELKDVKNKLKKTKNIKNHKRTDLNSKASEQRKKYKARITEIKDLLYNIDLEEKGSKIKSSDLLDTTLKESKTNLNSNN